MAEYEKTIAQMIGGCHDWSAGAQTVGRGKENGGGLNGRAQSQSSESSEFLGRDQRSCTCGCTLRIARRMHFTVTGTLHGSQLPGQVIRHVGKESEFGHWVV